MVPTSDILELKLKKIFFQCFNDGHEQSHLGLSAKDWYKALETAVNELTVCNQHNCNQNTLVYERSSAGNRADQMVMLIRNRLEHLCASNFYYTKIRPSGIVAPVSTVSVKLAPAREALNKFAP